MCTETLLPGVFWETKHHGHGKAFTAVKRDVMHTYDERGERME